MLPDPGQTAGIRRNRNGFTIGLLACVLGIAGCASPQQVVAHKEDDLAAAGFIVRPANSPERQAMLGRLPPHHFVMRTHGDVVDYVYADPLVCDCLYVGSQQAYNQYRFAMQQKKLADEQQMAAQLYADPGWEWGSWGPWGPGYGFGPGPGF